MTDGIQSGNSAFEAIDPKLTMFALANGVDLSKGEGHRRLEWFSDGFERGILIEVDDDGAFDIAVFKWASGDVELAKPEPFHIGVAADEVLVQLDPAVEATNAL